jgi:hypothetical protein
MQPLKKFPAFNGTRRFNTLFTRALRGSLSWARSIQSTPSHPISLRCILIPPTHLRLGLPSGLFPSGFPTNTYTHSSSPHSCYMPGPSHPPWLDHSNYTSRRVQAMNLPSLHLSSVQIFSTLYTYIVNSIIKRLINVTVTNSLLALYLQRNLSHATPASLCLSTTGLTRVCAGSAHNDEPATGPCHLFLGLPRGRSSFRTKLCLFRLSGHKQTLGPMFGRCLLRISAGTPYPAWSFRGFIQYLPADIGVVPPLDNNRFVPNLCHRPYNSSGG